MSDPAAVPPGGDIDHGYGARTDLWSLRTRVPELGQPLPCLWQDVRRASNPDRSLGRAGHRIDGCDSVPQASASRARFGPRASPYFAGPLHGLKRFRPRALKLYSTNRLS